MSTRDNAPPPADWRPDCRCGECGVCTPPLKMPDCELGEN